MVDPRGRVRVSRVSQVERTAPSSNMIKPVSRAPFTSRAAKPPVVSPNQQRFNQMSPERQQKFQDIQDANGVNFGATRPIYRPGTLGAQNQGVQYTPISSQVPMTPSSAPPAPQQVGRVDTYPPTPIMAPPGTGSPHDMLKNGGAVQPTPSQAAPAPYNIGGLSVPNPNGFLPSTNATIDQIDKETQAYKESLEGPVMPPNLTPQGQEAWAANQRMQREQANRDAVGNTLSGGGSRLMGPNGMAVPGGGGGYLPPTAGGSGLPLRVITGRDGKPVLRDGRPMVETVKPPETAYPPLSQEALAAREAMRLKYEAAEKARREKALGIAAPQTAPPAPATPAPQAAPATPPGNIAAPPATPAAAAPPTIGWPIPAMPVPGVVNTPLSAPPAPATAPPPAPVEAPPAVNHRADSSNPKWMKYRQERADKHDAARLKITERAERESQLRQDRINWRKQMALPPSPETVIAMEAVRRGQLGGQGGLLDQRRDNMMMWGMMNQNQMDRERMQMDRDRMKSEDEYRKSQQDLDKQRLQAEDDYRKGQQNSQKIEDDIMKDMSSPDALEYKSLLEEYRSMDPTDPEREAIYEKVQQARDRWIQGRRSAAAPPAGGPIAPGTAPPPPAGSQPAPQGGQPAGSDGPIAPQTGPLTDKERKDASKKNSDNSSLASRFGLPINQATGGIDVDNVNVDGISETVVSSYAKPERGMIAPTPPTDKELSSLRTFYRGAGELTPPPVNMFGNPDKWNSYGPQAWAEYGIGAAMRSNLSDKEAFARVRALAEFAGKNKGVRSTKLKKDDYPKANGYTYRPVKNTGQIPGYPAPGQEAWNQGSAQQMVWDWVKDEK